MPLAGAFGGAAPASPKAEPRVFTGPVLTVGQLDGPSEDAILRANDGRATLCAFRAFDAARPPVILVHGINGAPEDLQSLAERLHAAGKQVFFVAYDDMGNYPSKSGIELAAALESLRTETYAPGTRLDIVAHSMGGIVTRAALNELAAPGWVDGAAQPRDPPRAGFGPIRVRTIDTPWDGFEAPGLLQTVMNVFAFIVQPLFWLISKIFGIDAIYAMQANSTMFSHLYEPRLAGVDIQNTAAIQDDPDGIVALPDLDESDRMAVARAIIEESNDVRARLRNVLGGLRQDSRFRALRLALCEELHHGRIDFEAGRGADVLTRTYERVMPREQGTHVSVAVDDLQRQDDLVDRLVSELRR